MATRKRRTTVRTTSKSAPKKRRTAVKRTRKTNGNLVNFFVPLFLIACILGCLGFLGFVSYRTVTASEFFEVKKIDIRGISRVSKGDIENIVKNQTEKSGVWNADLKEIKEKVEKITFVKSAAVSRVLPDGVRVNVVEREPKAVVRIESSDFWADAEGVLIAPVGKNEERPPFVLCGWDQSKGEKSFKDNQQRIKIYQEMFEDWKAFNLNERVKEVNLSDLNNAKATVVDSGFDVFIELGKDNFAKHLQDGIKGIASKGNNFAGIISDGKNLRLIPRENN
jgi:cell division protein FtsQ